METPIDNFLKCHLRDQLVIQTQGNPFLIGMLIQIDDCGVALFQEDAGYSTFVPIREIVEVHTVVV